MHDPTQSATQRTGRALLMTLALTLLTACVKPGGSETEAAICRELRADLPTYSRDDTPETVRTGARFVGTFNALCRN